MSQKSPFKKLRLARGTNGYHGTVSLIGNYLLPFTPKVSRRERLRIVVLAVVDDGLNTSGATPRQIAPDAFNVAWGYVGQIIPAASIKRRRGLQNNPWSSRAPRPLT